jgi:hypothetical protein
MAFLYVEVCVKPHQAHELRLVGMRVLRETTRAPLDLP